MKLSGSQAPRWRVAIGTPTSSPEPAGNDSRPPGSVPPGVNVVVHVNVVLRWLQPTSWSQRTTVSEASIRDPAASKETLGTSVTPAGPRTADSQVVEIDHVADRPGHGADGVPRLVVEPAGARDRRCDSPGHS